MINKEDYKIALEDLHDLMSTWAAQDLDASECVFAGLSTFLSAVFELAPDKEEIHTMITAAFARSLEFSRKKQIQGATEKTNE